MSESPMQMMLREREVRMRSEQEANASLMEFHQKNPTSNLQVRRAWDHQSPIVNPVLLGSVSHEETTRARTAWRPQRRLVYSGPPSIREIKRVRMAWEQTLLRPRRPVGALGTPTGFWSWIRWLGSGHFTKDYVKQWSQHIEMDPGEITMLTFEACQFLLAHQDTNNTWSVQTPAPYSQLSRMIQDGPTGLDRYDSNSNTCYGVDNRSRTYFDTEGSSSNERMHLYRDAVSTYLLR